VLTPFFDEIRDVNAVLPNGRPLPALFNFSESELRDAGQYASKLVPPHYNPSANGNNVTTTTTLNSLKDEELTLQ